jgi:hypothetical protein
VISGIVGFPGPLLDHDPFGIASAASDLRIDIILPIATRWKASFSVLEITAADIAWEWKPLSLFQLAEQIIGFPRRRGQPRGIVGLWRKRSGGILDEGVLTQVGNRDADRWNEDDRAAQGEK